MDDVERQRRALVAKQSDSQLAETAAMECVVTLDFVIAGYAEDELRKRGSLTNTDAKRCRHGNTLGDACCKTTTSNGPLESNERP